MHSFVMLKRTAVGISRDIAAEIFLGESLEESLKDFLERFLRESRDEYLAKSLETFLEKKYLKALQKA